MIFKSEPSLGLMVATHGSSMYVQLQLEMAKIMCPGLPVLVHDDSSDENIKLRRLCKKYGADFATTTYNMGHQLGDLSAFVQGLKWAEGNGIELFVKFSRRWLPLIDWRPELISLTKSQNPTYSNRCITSNFGFRSECVAMHTQSWLPYIRFMQSQIASRHVDGCVEQALHNMARHMHKSNTCPVYLDYIKTHPFIQQAECYTPWSMMSIDRTKINKNWMWHYTHLDGEYLSLLRFIQGNECSSTLPSKIDKYVQVSVQQPLL